METLVLIPQELSLALRPGGARGREASVSVWTSTELQRGSLLYPFQGTIRIDKLHVYSYVADHDVDVWMLEGISRTDKWISLKFDVDVEHSLEAYIC
ncbi:hypothetical protein RR48_11428 [Papilio machaon]|uniref:Uncharacterized protein n=1 Tax=Papilio machaon TaxID=76193 RepID=A0A194QNJ6_PAPMA|nr:hypothetical protein RR48_11428 [Papilio machaon]